MTAGRLAFACSLAALALLLPTAAAQEGSPPPCAPEDIAYWYNLAHADGSFETADHANATREGSSIWLQANADLHCEGQPLTLVVWASVGDELTFYDGGQAEGYRPVAQASFAYWEVFVDVPECAYRIELWFGEVDEGVLLDAADGGDGACTLEEPAEAPPCPGDLAARANPDGSITVTWSASEGAEDYYVMRMVGDGEDGWHRVAVTTNTTWTDEDTEPGVVYTYWVMAHAEGQYSDNCATVQATAVPFLGAPLLAALAVVGSVGAYAWLRRKA